MKVKKIENLVGITLEATAKELAVVKKYEPNALKLFDEDENCKFAVTSSSGDYCGSYMGELNDYSAVFIEVGEKPLIWMAVPSEEVKHAKKFIIDNYGMALAKLSTVEKQVKAAVEAANAKAAAISEVVEELAL